MSIPSEINTIAILRQTAQSLANEACSQNWDAASLVEKVMDNHISVVSMEFNGTSFLRICIEIFEQTAMTCQATCVAILRGAVKLLKPIYQAALRKDD